MGIVYYGRGYQQKLFYGKGYKSNETCSSSISRQRVPKVLTRQSVHFLKSIGLRIVPGGK